MLYLLYLLLAVVLCIDAEEKLEFVRFMHSHDRSYSSEEFGMRFGIFRENLKKIENLNRNSKHATFGVNLFADYSTDEFRSTFLGTRANPKPRSQRVTPNVPSTAIPANFDWRSSKNVVTAVKDQGQCGSCWAFSATENVESIYALAKSKLNVLSEQQLVDCSGAYGNEGCSGGLMDSAFQYLIAVGGQELESTYPYTAEDGSCQFDASKIVAKISNYTDLPNDEGKMATWLYQNGPISVAVDAETWQFYVAGVLADIPCGTQLDHGVLAVGYGTETDIFGFSIDFWSIRNSWSASWGEAGYIRIQRGIGMCGIDLDPCSSIV